MRKVELLPTRDGEAGYGPGAHAVHSIPYGMIYRILKSQVR